MGARVASALVATSLAIWSIAFADDTGVAEQLFRDGKRLLGEGKVEEACRAFEGSYRKDPAVTTLVNLADCQEKAGRVATAWATFVQAERLLRGVPDQRALHDVAQARAQALEPRRSYLQVEVSAGAMAPGLEILRGGALLDRAEWNARMAVDGGVYEIVARAPGKETWTTIAAVSPERDWRVVKVPALASREPALPAIATTTRVRPHSRRRQVGLWTAAGGGGLVLASLPLGYAARSSFADAKATCGDDLVCDSETTRVSAQADVDAARRRGNLATALAVTGAVAVGVGVTLWLTATDRRRPESRAALRVAPQATETYVGLSVRGAL